mmetsp:Transcript_3745/g.6571  ORF Transcript_3745/g.6571 Transcript_3745/m.6571 type:complete len:599 (+) Transcript_3745:129-1925(+)|eukprot:CAMPEP_0196658312 /NCGR_PEP_ID=MMETSP1086-20130531/28970_1 /TAXON_ID=77921 /ORGANISM="Cyanoptyche  gloeocystis , Strain SAG4.97" /LENGTH=598 /DNA_ID=CAMNT_0041991829 /DNA_START=99 /DNA_END=1895 /DNA_ORIENTATION=-
MSTQNNLGLYTYRDGNQRSRSARGSASTQFQSPSTKTEKSYAGSVTARSEAFGSRSTKDIGNPNVLSSFTNLGPLEPAIPPVSSTEKGQVVPHELCHSYEELFYKYSTAGKMTKKDWARFTSCEQLEQLPISQAAQGKNVNEIDFQTFSRFMDSKLNQPFRSSKHDMSRPLSDYFIYASSSTFLAPDGQTSVEMYRLTLQAGVRCVEVPVWDGDGDIVVGPNSYSKLPLKEVLKSIKKHAFDASPYPIIIELVSHLLIPANVAALPKILKSVFGNMLAVPTLLNENARLLPSPEQLRNKILLMDAFDSGHAGEIDTIVFLRKFESKTIPEEDNLRPIAVWTAAAAEIQKMQDISSFWKFLPFVEKKITEEVNEVRARMQAFNRRKLSITTPTSATDKPSTYWSCGFQLVAVNRSLKGLHLQVNEGFFLQNGHLGYVLKPSPIQSITSSFKIKPGAEGTPCKLRIVVISVKPVSKASSYSRNLAAVLEILGMPHDCAKIKIKPPTNASVAIWNEMVHFNLALSEIALLRLILTEDGIETASGLASIVLPVANLREGFRSIFLVDDDGIDRYLMRAHITAEKDFRAPTGNSLSFSRPLKQ